VRRFPSMTSPSGPLPVSAGGGDLRLIFTLIPLSTMVARWSDERDIFCGCGGGGSCGGGDVMVIGCLYATTQLRSVNKSLSASHATTRLNAALIRQLITKPPTTVSTQKNETLLWQLQSHAKLEQSPIMGVLLLIMN